MKKVIGYWTYFVKIHYFPEPIYSLGKQITPNILILVVPGKTTEARLSRAMKLHLTVVKTIRPMWLYQEHIKSYWLGIYQPKCARVLYFLNTLLLFKQKPLFSEVTLDK